MKLLSFVHQGRRTYGVLKSDEQVAELGHGQVPHAPDLRSFMALPDAERAAAVAAAKPIIALSSISFLPVIPNPDKFFCAGSNYDGHRIEAGRAALSYPAIFMRHASSLTGHDTPIHLSVVSKNLDFEGELAVVIGKAGRYIPEAQALDHVGGYASFMDGSFRDWQQHTHQITPGKNFPGSGALGPYLVTPDEIPKLSALKLQTLLNGHVEQSATVSEMTFSIQRIIAYISGFTALSVGDVIATGTPAGVGFTRKPPLFMKEGDRIEIRIDSVGELRNVIADPV